jgi:hypothetical protein
MTQAEVRRSLEIACAVLGLLGAPVVSASERPPAGSAVPVIHEETGRSVRDLIDQLEELGIRLRERFASRDLPHERPLISIMLSHRAELGLSSGQVEALERLRAEFQKEAIRVEADVRVAETDLRLLLAADPVDLARVEGKIREIEKRRADLRVARIRTIEQGRAQLTPEQRQRLRTLLVGDRPVESEPVPSPSPGRL